MKTYGKEPESLRSIIAVFARDLADYPIGTVLKAISTHAQRSQEFPTTADIVGLIKRNGKPPFSQAMYVSIQKKDGEHRTPDDWKYLREYEAAQCEEFDGPRNTRYTEEVHQENQRLRAELTNLRKENKRLADLLQEARVAKGFEPPVPTAEEKVRATIAAMRQAGAPEADIDEFAREHGLSAELTA